MNRFLVRTMTLTGVIFLVASLILGPRESHASSADASTASQATNPVVWDLGSLYGSEEAWEAEWLKVVQELAEIRQHKGQLARNSRNLAVGLGAITDLRTRAGKMAVYGTLLWILDSQSAEAQRKYDIGIALENEVEAATAYADVEIADLPLKKLRNWRSRDQVIDANWTRIQVARRIADTGRQSKDLEVAIMLKRRPQMIGDVYASLMEADLGWPEIRLKDGSSLTLSPQAYSNYRSSASFQDRRAAATLLDERLQAVEEPLGMLLVSKIDAELALAGKLGFGSGIDAFFFMRDGVPPGVGQLAAKAAVGNPEIARRYAELRARAVGDDQYDFGATYLAPPAIEQRYSIADADAAVLEALSVLGSDYQERLRLRLAKPWRHLLPAPAKRSDFATYYPVGGADPYTVMTFRGTHRSARALSGAAALMMAYADILEARVPDSRRDPAVYSNSLVYFGNILFDDYIIKQEKDQKRKAAYLVAAIDRVWQEFYGNAVAMEFESQIEKAVAAGDRPSGAELSRKYLEILRNLYGVSITPDFYRREWMLNAVSFGTHEYHSWAPAMAVACVLAAKLQDGRDADVQAVLGALAEQESDQSYDVLKRHGINLEDRATYSAPTRRIEALMNELEATLNN